MAPLLDEALLNDPDYIAERDSRRTLLALATAGAQVRQAVTLSREAGIERVAGGERPRSVLVASLGGSAVVADGSVVLVIGDLSFLHDLGALVTARLHELDLLVVVINNDGGGIFSLLPQARTAAPGAGLPARYEELFGTPHGIALGPIVEAFGFRHSVVGAAGFAVLQTAIGAELGRPGLRVLELRTDRSRNADLHRDAAAAVASALAALVGERRH